MPYTLESKIRDSAFERVSEAAVEGSGERRSCGSIRMELGRTLG